MDNTINPESLEWMASAEQLKTSVEEMLKEIKLRRTVYSRNKPTLVVDFHHNIKGEIISIKDIDDAIKESTGVYRILLFKSDNVGEHIPKIVEKLRENIKKMRGWVIIFTESDKYSHINEFNRFMLEEKEDVEVIKI